MQRPAQTRGVLVRCTLLAMSAVCAALVAVRSRTRPTSVLLGRPACLQAQAAKGSMMMQQDALCTSLCGGSAIGLAECSRCGTTNVNIILPGSQPYYPGYSYADSSCYESSYDPLEWYDYYFKYDSALAPYYVPPPAGGESETQPEPEEAPEEQEEDELPEDDTVTEDDTVPEEEAPKEEVTEEKQEEPETAAVEEPMVRTSHTPLTQSKTLAFRVLTDKYGERAGVNVI